MSKLIDAPKGILEIVDLLHRHNYEAFVVGGAVRDSLLKLIPNDWDVATNCLPEETMKIFKDYRVIATGLKHGTVSILVNDIIYEITTYRVDGAYSDGRHPDSVTFTSSLEEDLARRDFSINAMAYNPISNTLFDPFEGQLALFRGMIKAVGKAEDRIKEDYLRMLRAVRYASRFEFFLTTKLESAIQENAHLINNVSQERIFQELYKMASESGTKFAESIKLLKDLGLLKQILPEIDCMDQFPHTPTTHPEGCVFDHTLAALRCNEERDPILNLSILFHDIGKPIAFTNTDKIRYLMHHELGLPVLEKVAERLRMSNEQKETFQFVCKWHMVFHKALDISDYKLTQLILNKNWEILYKASKCDDASRGEELFDSAYWVEVDARIANLKSRAAEKAKFDEIKKAISGDVIMTLRNIGPSKQVGEIQNKTLEYIINEKLDIKQDREKIQEFILNAA
jgi:tRNA nucleotidyltransferase (CCA-adding enzyme)